MVKDSKNGYSLINKILESNEYDSVELLKPTKIYVNDIIYYTNKYNHLIKGFSHITGGGIIDNIPRIINKGFNMNITESWNIPQVFQWIFKSSDMSVKDMLNTYNCGIGMVIVFDKDTQIDSQDELIHLGEIINSNDYKINLNLIEKSFI